MMHVPRDQLPKVPEKQSSGCWNDRLDMATAATTMK
jgi:hypothetical protein